MATRPSYTKHARGRLARSATIWGASLVAGFAVPVIVGTWAGLPVPVISAVTALTIGVLTYRAQVSVQTRVIVYKLARRIDAEMVGAK